MLNFQGFKIMRKDIIDIFSHFEEIEWYGEKYFESWQLKFKNELGLHFCDAWGPNITINNIK